VRQCAVAERLAIADRDQPGAQFGTARGGGGGERHVESGPRAGEPCCDLLGGVAHGRRRASRGHALDADPDRIDAAFVAIDRDEADRRCDQGMVARIHGRRVAAGHRRAQAEKTPMKINVEVDCTPEEARRAMGLPDFTPVHERYVAMLVETVDKGASPEMMETLMRSWAPMGEAGMSFWKNMFEAGGKPG
jgi:hypothetical protein